MNRQFEVTWQTLKTISHSIMVHARVSDKYIHFTLLYMTHHIFPVLPIKHLINHGSEETMPHKLLNGTKNSVSNLSILFCPRGVQRATARVDGKALKMRHQSQMGFGVSLLELHNNKKDILSTHPVN